MIAWVIAILFGLVVIAGLWNGFMYAYVKVRHWYRKKVKHNRLIGDKVHRPKRIKKEV